MKNYAAIIAAAGKSSRFADATTKKVFVEVDGQPLWSYSARSFRFAGALQVLLVVAAEDLEKVQTRYRSLLDELKVECVVGGKERADSVLNGLAAVATEVDFVAVHDGARPCVSVDAIGRVCECASETGAAILAVKCAATIKRTNSEQWITETIPREDIWLAQTPQVFDVGLLRRAYQEHPSPSLATDEAAIVEATGHRVRVVPGEPTNIKVTTQADMEFVRSFLQR